MTAHPWIHRLAPWIAPIFVFLWSTGFIIARYSMPYAEPMTVIFIRFGSVVLCMLPVVMIWKAPWPNRSQIIHIAIAGALLQAGYVGGVWAAVKEGMSAGQLFLQVVGQRCLHIDRKSTRLNSSHTDISRMPSSA